MTGRILGAVLAGGVSSRFGADKAMAVWKRQTLLERARDALAAVADAIVIVGRGEVADLPMPGLGPLGGIAGALDHAARRGFDSVLTIGCDMPEVPTALLKTLIERLPAYCLDAPVLGHWPASSAATLIGHLTSRTPSSQPGAGVHSSEYSPAGDGAAAWPPGRARRDGALSVRRWAADIGAVAVPSPAPLRNINTPADMLSS